MSSNKRFNLKNPYVRIVWLSSIIQSIIWLIGFVGFFLHEYFGFVNIFFIVVFNCIIMMFTLDRICQISELLFDG